MLWVFLSRTGLRRFFGFATSKDKSGLRQEAIQHSAGASSWWLSIRVLYFLVLAVLPRPQCNGLMLAERCWSNWSKPIHDHESKSSASALRELVVKLPQDILLEIFVLLASGKEDGWNGDWGFTTWSISRRLQARASAWTYWSLPVIRGIIGRPLIKGM
jgi:hypothetical protein